MFRADAQGAGGIHTPVIFFTIQHTLCGSIELLPDGFRANASLTMGPEEEEGKGPGAGVASDDRPDVIQNDVLDFEFLPN